MKNSTQQDIGAVFDDPKLNSRFETKEGKVEPLFLFSLDQGVSYLTCRACGVKVAGKRNLDVHVGGKRHRTTMASLKSFGKGVGLSLLICPHYFLFSEPAPPGEEAPLPAEAAIQQMVDDFKEAPLIGIEFIVEILVPNADPIYKCELCCTTLTAKTVISDLISSAHRLKYLVSQL